jgi:hypothetical protein
VEAPTYFAAATDSKVNREGGIIEGVSVITVGVAKGHGMLVDGTTLEQVKACAEQFSDGVQVKVNHGTGFDAIVGVLRNFRIDGQKLIADLHLLRNHEKREHVLDVAEEMPGSVGLSISFSGETETINGKDYARCDELYSVDFVSRPAANPSGLFQRVDSTADGMAEVTPQDKSLVDHIRAFFSAPPTPINFEAKAKELETQLAEANLKITEFAALQAKFSELETAKAKADSELKAANEKLGKFDAEVAAKALQITSAQGQPPIVAQPKETAAAVKVELTGLDRVRACFEAQNKN